MKSWNEIRKAATAFSKRWKDAYDDKSQAQSSLKEFFAVFGVDSVSFGYNDRSEVTSATVFGIASSYGYDEIGNSTSYTPKSLNQYTEFAYDLDGNLLIDGVLSFTYDAANRLKTVVTNGVLLLTNFYDAKSRRVKKVTQEATTTFFYDDWNLIEERVAYTNGTTSTIRYYWGKDLSGESQGAGGVGGLLYLTIDGAVYVPFYDNIGNVTRYVDENGNTVAQYTYDAFGKLIATSGPFADFFRHRFSTKYFDNDYRLTRLSDLTHLIVQHSFSKKLIYQLATKV